MSDPARPPVTALHQRARHFLQTLASTREAEPDCEAAMRVIARYVELEAIGACPASLCADLPLHFAHCPGCAELYATMLQLASLEVAGHLPDVDTLWSELQEAIRPSLSSSRLDDAAGLH